MTLITMIINIKFSSGKRSSLRRILFGCMHVMHTNINSFRFIHFSSHYTGVCIFKVFFCVAINMKAHFYNFMFLCVSSEVPRKRVSLHDMAWNWKKNESRIFLHSCWESWQARTGTKIFISPFFSRTSYTNFFSLLGGTNFTCKIHQDRPYHFTSFFRVHNFVYTK